MILRSTFLAAKPASGSPPTFRGPGDVLSGARAWYGLSAYSAAVAATGTQKAVNVRRSSDNTTADILILTTGLLDIATATTFAAGSNLFATKWYDQSGNANDIPQATQANQPQLLLSAGPSSGKPKLTFSGSQWFFSATGISLDLPFTFTSVAVATTDTTNELLTFSDVNVQLRYDTGNLLMAYAGVVGTAPQTNGNWHAVVANYNFGASTLIVDNARTNVATGGSGSTRANMAIGNYGSTSTFPLTGAISQVGIWPIITADPDWTALNTNMHTNEGF
jgi:Alpha-L-arabinofuranosidase B, catalytic